VRALVDLSDIYQTMLEHNATEGLDHFYIPRAAVPKYCQRCEVRISTRDRSSPEVLHDAAAQACKTYLDRFAARTERTRESEEIAASKLIVAEQQ